MARRLPIDYSSVTGARLSFICYFEAGIVPSMTDGL